MDKRTAFYFLSRAGERSGPGSRWKKVGRMEMRLTLGRPLLVQVKGRASGKRKMKEEANSSLRLSRTVGERLKPASQLEPDVIDEKRASLEEEEDEDGAMIQAGSSWVEHKCRSRT